MRWLSALLGLKHQETAADRPAEEIPVVKQTGEEHSDRELTLIMMTRQGDRLVGRYGKGLKSLGKDNVVRYSGLVVMADDKNPHAFVEGWNLAVLTLNPDWTFTIARYPGSREIRLAIQDLERQLQEAQDLD